MFSPDMDDEEYIVGYNDYKQSNIEGRKLLFAQTHIRQDMYWQGVKAAHYNLEMEEFQW